MNAIPISFAIVACACAYLMPVMKRIRSDLVSQTQGRIRGRLFFPHAAFQLPELMDMRIIVCPVEGADPEGEPLPFNSSLLAASSPVFRQRMRRGALGARTVGFSFGHTRSAC